MTCGIGAFTGLAKKRRRELLQRRGLRFTRTIFPSWTLPLGNWGMLVVVAGPSTVLHLAPISSVLIENAGLRWKALLCAVRTVAPSNYLESPATSPSASLQ